MARGKAVVTHVTSPTILEVGDVVEMSVDSAVAADPINHPPYYGSDTGLECIDATRAALGKERFEAFLHGTVLTYLWRAGKKDGADALTDVRKARWYLDRLEASMSGGES